MKTVTKPYIDAAWQTIELMLESIGEVKFMVIAIDTRKSAIAAVVPAAGLSKAEYARALPLAIKEANADLAVMVSEAWTMVSDEADLERIGREGVAAQPDRQEVCVVEWKSADGEHDVSCRLLVRDTEGRPSLGASIDWPKDKNSMSRFMDGLFTDSNHPTH